MYIREDFIKSKFSCKTLFNHHLSLLNIPWFPHIRYLNLIKSYKISTYLLSDLIKSNQSIIICLSIDGKTPLNPELLIVKHH